MALFFRISKWMSAKRLTFMLQSVYIPPFSLVGLVDRRDTASARCLKRTSEVAQLVLKASAVRDDPHNEHQDRLALMECLGQLWFDRLLLVQLLWAKLKAGGYMRAPLYQFIWVYFSGIVHTKYVLEDALQHANHLVRASRCKDIRPQRLAYQVATAARLDECCNVPIVKVKPGDLALHADFDIVQDDFRLRKSDKSRQPAKVIQSAIECMQSKTAQVKQAGTLADDLALGAIIALQFTEPDNFQGISGLWPSALLQCGFIYIRKRDKVAFLAQEHLNYTTIGWKLTTINFNGTQYFKSPKLIDGEDEEAIKNLEFLKVTGLQSPDNVDNVCEEFEGVPFKLSPRNDLPNGLKSHGSLFEQTSPGETLIKHFIRNRSLHNKAMGIIGALV
jgi:hypothetical protein